MSDWRSRVAAHLQKGLAQLLLLLYIGRALTFMVSHVLILA